MTNPTNEELADHIAMEVKGWFETIFERPGETFTINFRKLLGKALDEVRAKALREAASVCEIPCACNPRILALLPTKEKL